MYLRDLAILVKCVDSFNKGKKLASVRKQDLV